MVEAKYTMLYNRWLSQQAIVGTYGSTLKGYITGKNKDNIKDDAAKAKAIAKADGTYDKNIKSDEDGKEETPEEKEDDKV